MSDLSIIAIDGPAASGKSTLGFRLAEALGYLYFDTGSDVSRRHLAGPPARH